ncbi:metalloproteinase 10, partial [Moniliophthora roreri]
MLLSTLSPTSLMTDLYICPKVVYALSHKLVRWSNNTLDTDCSNKDYPKYIGPCVGQEGWRSEKGGGVELRVLTHHKSFLSTMQYCPAQRTETATHDYSSSDPQSSESLVAEMTLLEVHKGRALEEVGGG